MLSATRGMVSFVFELHTFGWGKAVVWDRNFADSRKMPAGFADLVGFFFLSAPYPSSS